MVVEHDPAVGADRNINPGLTEVFVTRRGDLVAIRSAGAYGEIMASRYNCREFPAAIYSE